MVMMSTFNEKKKTDLMKYVLMVEKNMSVREHERGGLQ